MLDTKTLHTSGPWQVSCRCTTEFKERWYVETDSNYGVAKMVTSPNTSDGEREANAKLIAKAPELLKALKWATDWMEDVEDIDGVRCAPTRLGSVQKLIAEIEGSE